MVLVRKRHGLRANHADLRLVGRLHDQVADQQQPEPDQKRAEDRQPRQRVGTRVKNLRHDSPCSSDALPIALTPLLHFSGV